MGKRYFCDFCEKSFADNPTNRKNHMKGVHHKRMRSVHYTAFKDAAALYAEEESKPICKRFQIKGECDFGASCRYSHKTPEEKKALLDIVKAEKRRKDKAAADDAETGDALLQKWMEKWMKKQGKSYSGTHDQDSKTLEGNSHTLTLLSATEYELPAVFQGMPNLPPSLLPPPSDSWVGVPVEEWG